MALSPVDLEKGVIMKVSPAFGYVCMYSDEPGVYLTMKGAPVSPDVARSCGFDVDADMKEKTRLDRRSSALAAIDRDFGIIAEGEVVEDNGSVRLVHNGKGWFDVKDADGTVLNEQKLRREAASVFMEDLRKGKEHADGKAS